MIELAIVNINPRRLKFTRTISITKQIGQSSWSHSCPASMVTNIIEESVRKRNRAANTAFNVFLFSFCISGTVR